MTVRLERPIHYGNAGLAFSESRPDDDAYLFKPENTRDIWSHVRTITERYGYDFATNDEGDFVLATRNNAHVIHELTAASVLAQVSATVTDETAPNAYAGEYMEFVGTVPPFSYNVSGSRIDVIVPRGVGLGDWLVTVKQGGSPVAGPLTISPANAEEIQFYDARAAVDGTNGTVVTLYSSYFNEYTVEFASSGGSGGTIRRLDALMAWHTDPANPLYPVALSTGQNATSVAAKSTMDEIRNYVIVVGRRRASVTDSAKIVANPENPVDEFYVSSSVDVASVADPTASNYLGYLKQALIFDASISDQDFADYMSRTFIYRQRQPAPNATVTHTLLTAVELRDPVYVIEDEFETLDSAVVQHVVGISHQITGTEALTTLETTSYAEFPSYEVREDIDIDAKFNGSPVTNVEISYVPLTGGSPLVNLGEGLAHISGPDDVVVTGSKAVSGNAINMSGEPWPPLPGCVYLTPTDTTVGSTNVLVEGQQHTSRVGTVSPAVSTPGIIGLPTQVRLQTSGFLHSTYTVVIGTTPSATGYYYIFDPELGGGTVTVHHGTNAANVSSSSTSIKILVNYLKVGPGVGAAYQTNTPYHHLLEVDYRDSNRSIALPWKQGDGTSVYQRTATNYFVTYRRLGPVNGGTKAFEDPYSGVSPFYDPYTSEVGNFVNLSFDALVSGRYRVSVRNVHDDTVVAWLTEPTMTASDPEAHWQYMQAGAGKTFAWDGVDQSGEWNRRQSETYASAAHGAFEQDQKPLVGEGFYAWNREQAGQTGFVSRALIAGTRDADDKPVFGQGTWSEWYVRIEATNESLQEIAEWAQAHGGTIQQRSAIRVVNTTKMNETGDPADDYSARVYTHLPEPTKVELTVHDWIGTLYGRNYDPTDLGAINTTANWATGDSARGANADGIINNQQPLRIRFTPVSRPGVLWSGNDNSISFKLNRIVHLRANLADQFVMFAGLNYPGQDVENRRVVSRTLTNDDHTVKFADESWRHAPSLKTSDGGTGMEWIFSPRDFKKDFRGTPNEALVFGDYLQLEEVPGWSTDGAVAGARSRLQIAFMNYLFYLSAYTQDRSGRYTWCLNREFLDRSKLIMNQRTDWPDANKPTQWTDDMTTQFRRTVLARQWTDERVSNGSLWRDSEAVKWGMTSAADDAGYALLRHKWKEHENTGTNESTNAQGLPIGHTNWYQLKTTGGVAIDSYSNWHLRPGYGGDHDGVQGNGGYLPNTFLHQLYRQLGTPGASALGNWTWEGSPAWVPSVSRDFHGYYHVPPMCDYVARDNELVYNRCYDTVDYRGHILWNSDDRDVSERNTGGDVAVGTSWNSPVLDMTATPSLGTIKEVGVRFFPGRVVTADKAPTNTIYSNCIDYQRQTDLVFFEDLRGVYSRGPRKQEQPKKINSGNPYYQNPYGYRRLVADAALKQQKLLPLYRADITRWFAFTFRSEYLWESSRLFPTEQYGRERAEAFNVHIAQHLPASKVSNIRYDAGAWVGWKDDKEAQDTHAYWLDTSSTSTHTGANTNIFEGPYMPVSTGPRMKVTRDLIMHLVLVDERREVSIL